VALPALLIIQGVDGSVFQKDRERSIGLLGAEHEVVAGPSGVAHGRFRLLKEIDNATPALARALADGKRFETATLKFWRLPRGMKEENHLTIALFGAKVVGQRFRMLNIRDPALQPLPETEEISFTYESIRYDTKLGRIDSSSAEHCQSNSSDKIDAKVFLASAEESLSELVGGKAKQVGADVASALAAQGKEIGAAIAEGVRDGLKPADPEQGAA